MKLTNKKSLAVISALIFVSLIVLTIKKSATLNSAVDVRIVTSSSAAISVVPETSVPRDLQKLKEDMDPVLPVGLKTHSFKPNSTQYGTVSGSPANKEEMDRWALSRGLTYRIPGKKEEYDAYGIELLTKLAESGDIHAMAALAPKLGDPEKTIKMLKRAAVYGSTYTLGYLSVSSQTQYGEATPNSEERHGLMIDTLAYTKVASLRGDEDTAFTYGSTFISSNKIELTEEDKMQINIRAKNIYDDLQQQRIDIGLGDFDNSVPESVKAYNELMSKPVRSFCDDPKNKEICEELKSKNQH